MADNGINIQIKITDNSPEVLNAVKIAIKRAVGECGESARSYAWDGAPYKTGNLANSIKHIEKESGSGIKSYIGTNVEYAAAQEFGTSRGIRPKHYLLNAVANHSDEYKGIIKNSMQNV